ARNILVKRGNEWHGPEYMYVNASHIVVMEPVSPTSRMAQLIKEAKTAQPQPQATEPGPPEGAGGKWRAYSEGHLSPVRRNLRTDQLPEGRIRNGPAFLVCPLML